MFTTTLEGVEFLMLPYIYQAISTTNDPISLHGELFIQGSSILLSCLKNEELELGPHTIESISMWFKFIADFNGSHLCGLFSESIRMTLSRLWTEFDIFYSEARMTGTKEYLHFSSKAMLLTHVFVVHHYYGNSPIKHLKSKKCITGTKRKNYSEEEVEEGGEHGAKEVEDEYKDNVGDIEVVKKKDVFTTKHWQVNGPRWAAACSVLFAPIFGIDGWIAHSRESSFPYLGTKPLQIINKSLKKETMTLRPHEIFLASLENIISQFRNIQYQSGCCVAKQDNFQFTSLISAVEMVESQVTKVFDFQGQEKYSRHASKKNQVTKQKRDHDFNYNVFLFGNLYRLAFSSIIPNQKSNSIVKAY
jgi:hypothetical protein